MEVVVVVVEGQEYMTYHRKEHPSAHLVWRTRAPAALQTLDVQP